MRFICHNFKNQARWPKFGQCVPGLISDQAKTWPARLLVPAMLWYDTQYDIIYCVDTVATYHNTLHYTVYMFMIWYHTYIV